MEGARELSLLNVSKEFMKSADVLLVLDNGMAILCHSQILSLHSAVLRNMLADLPAKEQDERLKIPLHRGAVLSAARILLQQWRVQQRRDLWKPLRYRP